MCREDMEPELGCDCDYCIGFAQGVIEMSGMTTPTYFGFGPPAKPNRNDYDAEKDQAWWRGEE